MVDGIILSLPFLGKGDQLGQDLGVDYDNLVDVLGVIVTTWSWFGC